MSRRISPGYSVVALVSVLALAACSSTAGGPSAAPSHAAPAAAASSAPQTLVVLGFGGNIQATLQKATAAWQKQNNVTIQWEAGTSVSNAAKAVAEEGHPDIDVVLAVDTSQYIASQKGAWQKIDTTEIPNLANVYPVAKTAASDGVGMGLIITGIFYNPTAYKNHGWNPPTSYASLADYLSDPAYCGHIGMLSPQVTEPLEAAWVIGKGNVEAGIQQLAKLKNCVPTLVANVATYESQIGAGQYVVGIENQLHTVPLIEKGAPLKFIYPSEGTSSSMTVLSIPKGAPHAKLAESFINDVLTPAAQAELASGAAFAPTVKGVSLTPTEIADGLPTQQDLNSGVVINRQVWAANQSKWINDMEAAFSK